jgi:hypothetical protein
VFGTTTLGPGCGPNQLVSVTGAAFPINSAATLTDDGNQVASGSTDAMGAVTLSYTAASEAGLYRTLTVTVGTKSATTDMENNALFCLAQQTNANFITLTLTATGLDAGSANVFIRFGSQPSVAIHADANGAGTVTTPSYPCTAGHRAKADLYGHRGAAGPQNYKFFAVISLTC